MNLDETGRRIKDAIDLLESEADALGRDTTIRTRDPLAAQAISAAAGLLAADCCALVDEVRHLRAATGCADPDRREGHCCGLDDVEVSR